MLWEGALIFLLRFCFKMKNLLILLTSVCFSTLFIATIFSPDLEYFVGIFLFEILSITYITRKDISPISSKTSLKYITLLIVGSIIALTLFKYRGLFRLETIITIVFYNAIVLLASLVIKTIYNVYFKRT